MRKVGVVTGSRYVPALIRNLSETGALVEGFNHLERGAPLMLNFGDGQLAFARVSRAGGRGQGIEFDRPLVSDGNGGLCTSHRVSPYLLGTVGLPASTDPDKEVESNPKSWMPLEELATKLGLVMAPSVTSQSNENNDKAVAYENTRTTGTADPELGSVDGQHGRRNSASKVKLTSPTLEQLSKLFLNKISNDPTDLASVSSDLNKHILPHFAHIRLDQLAQSGIFSTLGRETYFEDLPPETVRRLQLTVEQMCVLAVQLRLPGSETIKFSKPPGPDPNIVRGGVLTPAQATRLLRAARNSPNPQLKFVVAFMMLTGVKHAELLNAHWSQIDFGASIWRVPSSKVGEARNLFLDSSTIALLRALPRWGGCPFVLANPLTKRAYRSFARSWNSARVKAGLTHMEINDLTFFDLRRLLSSEELMDAVMGSIQAENYSHGTAAGKEATNLSDSANGPQPLAQAA